MTWARNKNDKTQAIVIWIDIAGMTVSIQPARNARTTSIARNDYK
jgi:hypothetical protein